VITNAPVLVTGASGFVASHIVEQLLAKGYRVRGTVRSLLPEKLPTFLQKLPGASERLELVTADLLTEGAFDKAAQGCEFVMHTASPYVLDVKDAQKDLVDPAVNGSVHVLSACSKSGSVKRVILTSSMAAITDEPDSDHVLSEEDWNIKSSLERNPYYYSKTLAEKAAWNYVEQQKRAFDLVVINPFLVIGPSKTKVLNPSNQLFVDLVKGTYPGIMNLTWGFVDVRDVARSHILAMESNDARGRYICAGETSPMRNIVELLAKLGYEQGYKLPKIGLDCGIGDFAVRLSSYTQPKGVGTYLRTHVGRVPRYDNSKIRSELGLNFLPLEQSITDTMIDLKRWEHISPSA
jgi:dihydroflavonol-4-reductase